MDNDIAKSANRSYVGSWIALLLPVLFLSILGLLVLMSAGAGKSDPLILLKKQTLWMCIALTAGIGAAFVKLEAIRKYAIPLAVVSVVLLILVVIPQIGKEVNGARRWLAFGPVVFQPSDIAKFALVILLSSYLYNYQRHNKTFLYGFVMPFGILAVFCGLIILEPDFGTTALCGSVGFALIFLAGVRAFFLIPSVLGAGALFSVILYFNPNRVQRLVSFLDFEGNKAEGTYQLYQAILAFGAGGVMGVGLGQGRQQLSFLPEAHTDFIFAVLGEEHGLIFTSLVAFSFFCLFAITMFKLRSAPNLFEFCLAVGSMLMIVLQALFNMCVVTGLVPTKGISLPFISYGGSNLVVMFAFTGILLNCIRSWSKPTEIQASRYE